jgi:hypothetical protein
MDELEKSRNLSQSLPNLFNSELSLNLPRKRVLQQLVTPHTRKAPTLTESRASSGVRLVEPLTDSPRKIHGLSDNRSVVRLRHKERDMVAQHTIIILQGD